MCLPLQCLHWSDSKLNIITVIYSGVHRAVHYFEGLFKWVFDRWNLAQVWTSEWLRPVLKEQVVATFVLVTNLSCLFGITEAY